MVITVMGGGLRLVHADKSSGTLINGEKVNISTGHVHFQQDTLHMFCDESRFYENQDKAEFIGSVLIYDGKNTLRARQVDYFGKTRLAVCTGNVRIRTQSDSLYADYFTYNFKSGRAVGKKSLFIYSINDHTIITAEEGMYERQSGHSLVKINCHLTKIDSGNGDTLHISSGEMEYFQNPVKSAIARDSVVIEQGGLLAKCDTARYLPNEEVIWLINQPRAWFELSSLKGDKMKVQLDSLQFKNITVLGRAYADNRRDSVSVEKNILEGKEIRFYIEDKKPKIIKAIDNASSIYYLVRDDTKQGSNYATADTIVVYFKEGELDSIDVMGGAQGVYYPEEYHGDKGFE